jgi:hypothetical protein
MDILKNAKIMTCHCDSTLQQSSSKSEKKKQKKKNFIQIIIINYFQFNQNSTSSVTPENENIK